MWSIKKLTAQSAEARFDLPLSNDLESWIFLPGDVHFDNPHCRRSLYFKHMQKAKELGALVIYSGDFFCAMQGKYDPRRSKSGVRPEYNTNRYIDLLVSDAANLHDEFKGVPKIFFKGNHETGVLRNIETDLLERLSQTISGESIVMGYRGYIRLRVGRENDTRTKNLAVHHGKWGGVVSKGTQTWARFGPILPDADVIVTGHTHDQWAMPIQRFRFQRNGEVTQDTQLHLKVPTYKDEFTEAEGWAEEKIVAPKPLGGYFLKVTFNQSLRHLEIMEIRA